MPSFSCRQTLLRHPASPLTPLQSLTATMCSAARAVVLRYTACGDLTRLQLPPLAAALRTDELWRSTCFELFVGNESSEVYREFNFSPSTQWAAYELSGYRQGMRALELPVAPQLVSTRGAESYVLDVHLPLAAFAGMTAALSIGLTAVIADNTGGVSYWALSHPALKADFHRREGRVLRVARDALEQGND